MQIKKMILIVIACVMYTVSSAQEVQEQLNLSLENVNTIVFKNLDGNTSIIKSSSDELNVKSELLINGDNWGWKFPEDRPKFKIEAKQSNDTLYIITLHLFSYKT
ncbi:MAG: hypothetical protein C0598_14025, partial [Marinilabiliales bacterium]